MTTDSPEPISTTPFITPDITLKSGDTFDVDLLENTSRILDTLLQGYDRNFRPGIKGPPLIVKVDISVLSIGPVSELNMQFALDCYFRQSWVDERLRFKGPLQTLTLNAVKFVGSIWKPDTYIRNGRDSYLHQITVPNKLLRLKQNGEILISQRLTLKPKCPMFLKKFPMDTQACPMEIGSLGYSTNDIIYIWGKLKTSFDVKLSQYNLDAYYYAERNLTSFHHLGEACSTLVAHFKLRRLQGFYLLQIYLPCMMIVALSWVSFWINKDASPARVALGVMTVLTISTLGSGGIRSHLPKVSYGTGLDLYVVACFGFVFTALVEFAVINFTNRVYWRNRQQDAKSNQVMAASLSFFAEPVTAASQQMQGRVARLQRSLELEQISIAQTIQESTLIEREIQEGGEPETEIDGSKSPQTLDTPLSALIPRVHGGTQLIRETMHEEVITRAESNTAALEHIQYHRKREQEMRQRREYSALPTRSATIPKPHFPQLSREKNLTLTPSTRSAPTPTPKDPLAIFRLASGGGRMDPRRRSTLKRVMSEQNVVDYIDDVAKVAFPLVFLLFNIIYWALYLYWLPNEAEQVLSETYDNNKGAIIEYFKQN